MAWVQGLEVERGCATMMDHRVLPPGHRGRTAAPGHPCEARPPRQVTPDPRYLQLIDEMISRWISSSPPKVKITAER